ncbi:MAG: ABC transporter substrate-binding protein [Deltaproteobacteria bacterium]|nr:ABC transporter substrate-binding protein [Deltaproteobacteria bacterium]
MNKIKKVQWLLLTGALACFIVFLFTTPGTAKVVPKGKATIVNSTSFEMAGGDCHQNTGASGTTITSFLYDGLACKHPDGKLYPALAKSWKIAANWSKITAILDERATFADGTPVTATDVKFSIERAQRPELKFVFGGELRRYIERVEIVDPHKVVIHLKSPYPAFMDRTAKILGTVPKAYVEKLGDAEFLKNPMGAGPYKFIKYKQDVFFDVVARDEHYRKVGHVKYLHYMIVPEPATRLAMLQTGEGDVVGIVAAHIPVVLKDPKLKLGWSKYTYLRNICFYACEFPDEPSPLLDRRVRMAVAYAINAKAICEKVLLGSAEPWSGCLAPYHAGFDPKAKPYPYDPEKAKALLKEAGYPKGFETVLYSDLPVKTSTEAIAASLRKVGIKAKVTVPEHMIWTRMIAQKKLRGMGSHPTPWWAGRTHPATALQSTFAPSSPWTFKTTPELVAALQHLSKQIEDKDVAVAARELNRLYLEQAFRINLWAVHIPYGLSAKVKYWENVAGRVFPVAFEFMTLND